MPSCWDRDRAFCGIRGLVGFHVGLQASVVSGESGTLDIHNKSGTGIRSF